MVQNDLSIDLKRAIKTGNSYSFIYNVERSIQTATSIFIQNFGDYKCVPAHYDKVNKRVIPETTSGYWNVNNYVLTFVEGEDIIADLEQRVEDLETMTASQSSRLDSLETTTASHTASITSLSATVQGHTAEISALNTGLDAVGDTTESQGAEIALLRKLINGIDAPIYLTASGNPAIFSDGYPDNVKALAVSITPTQSGSGVPSPDNIRPISGVSSVTVRRTRKNLFGGTAVISGLTDNGVNATVDATNRTVTFVSSTARHSPLIFSGYPFKANTVYTWIIRGYNIYNPPSSNIRFKYTDGTASGAPNISNSADNPSTVKLTSAVGKTVLGIQAIFGSGTSVLYYDQCGLFEGNIAVDAFEEYQGQSVTVQLIDGSNPLTVYGGTLDVTTGTLVVTHSNIASYNGETLPGRWISDRDVYASGTTPTIGAQVVYELAEPVTHTLTPAQLATLSGYNAVSTSVETLTVAYRVDPKLV